jgi:hypothetical protein
MLTPPPAPALNLLEVLAKHAGDAKWTPGRVAGRLGVELQTLTLALKGKPLSKPAQRLLHLLDMNACFDVGETLDTFSAGTPVERSESNRKPHTGILADGFRTLKARGVVKNQTDLGRLLGLHQPMVSAYLLGKVEFPEGLQARLRDLLAEHPRDEDFISRGPIVLPGLHI